MPDEYRKNHYVPVWYQKGFINPAATDRELLYLDLKPGHFTDPRGISHPNKSLRRLGPKHCFYERDLYTANLPAGDSTEIERVFFGSIDSNGRDAVRHFADFQHLKPGLNEAFQKLVIYMSTQKLRTPKGLQWLNQRIRTSDKNVLLRKLLELKQLFCAIWSESIWLIADASKAETKFIVSDHPVTVYNRRCGPRSQWCRGCQDPDIWLAATQTLLPLSRDKILILTNLAWVRNPYQSPTALRPNPNPFRDAIFSSLDIQTDRFLTEQEVREINFIIKSRAFRYIAAEKEDWLYPENYVSKSDWATYGKGYLLMPDPRTVGFKGEMYFGFNDGSSTAFDEYGNRPWQPGYGGPKKNRSLEWKMFNRFKGEFAHLFGPYRRGRAYEFGRLDPERDSDDMHNHNLRVWAKRK